MCSRSSSLHGGCWTVLARMLVAGSIAAIASRAGAQAGIASLSPTPDTKAEMGVTFPETGECQVTVVKANELLEQTRYARWKKASKEDFARRVCLDRLLPRNPTAITLTPGAFMIGYAWGFRSKQFLYGPQVAISTAYQIPIRRPLLDTLKADASSYTFGLPTSATWTVDLVVSLNTALGSYSFPNADSSKDPTTQQTYNIGGYIAGELGWRWWSDDLRTAHRWAVSMGLMAGMIDTSVTGRAFALGVQPSIVAQF